MQFSKRRARFNRLVTNPLLGRAGVPHTLLLTRFG